MQKLLDTHSQSCKVIRKIFFAKIKIQNYKFLAVTSGMQTIEVLLKLILSHKYLNWFDKFVAFAKFFFSKIGFRVSFYNGRLFFNYNNVYSFIIATDSKQNFGITKYGFQL